MAQGTYMLDNFSRRGKSDLRPFTSRRNERGKNDHVHLRPTTTIIPPYSMPPFRTNPIIPALAAVDLFDPSIQQTTCPICRSNFVDPVTLPCHATHQFCRDCIVQWLNRPGRKSCPTCRTAFFDSIQARQLSRPQAVQLALQNSALQVPREATMPTHIDTLGLEAFAPGSNFFMSSEVSNAATSAASYLARVDAQEPHHDSIDGTGLIDADKLLVHLLVMSKLIQALAAVELNDFTADDISDWELIVKQIGKGIGARHGKRRKGRRFRRRLRRSLNFDEPTRGLDFLVEPWTTGYVNQLLDYIAFVAWQQEQERKHQKAARKTQKSASNAGVRKAMAKLKDLLRHY